MFKLNKLLLKLNFKKSHHVIGVGFGVEIKISDSDASKNLKIRLRDSDSAPLVESQYLNKYLFSTSNHYIERT